MDPTQNNDFGNQPPMGTGGFGAPVNPGVPMSSGTGDIVLNNDGGKSKKKWWIIGGVLGVLLLCAVGCILLFMAFQGGSEKEMETAWNRYYNYLMYGEDDRLDGELGDTTVETWYPATIGTLSVQEETEDNNRYYDDLKERYDTFSNSSRKTVDNVLIYNDVFKAFYDYNVISDLERTIIDKYNNGGMDGAISYIDSIDDGLTKDDTLVGGLYDNLKVYLRAYLSVVNYYNEKDCNYLEANNMNCPQINSNNETMTKLNMLYRRKSNLDYYYREIYVNYVFENTLLMNRQIKEE